MRDARRTPNRPSPPHRGSGHFEKGLADLDPERRAAMVSNMLVVLCSERPAQPIVNTGTIY